MENDESNEVVEDLLHGKLKIIQKKEGYRFSIDAILLANFAGTKKRDRIIDLGTGCGVIPLVLSWKNPESHITGLEIDHETAGMAKRSVELNGLIQRITIVQGDVREIKAHVDVESFEIALANPPYGRPDSGRIDPSDQKAAARHEISTSLDDFLSAAAYAVRYRGRIFIIFPAKRLADLITGLKNRGFEPKRMRLVHSRMGEKAKLVLMEGIKRGGAEMEVLAPLYIYDREGNYTPEIKKMYK